MYTQQFKQGLTIQNVDYNEDTINLISEIINEVKKHPTQLVMITGGEPLLQKKSIDLMQCFIDEKYSVMLETSGSLSLQNVPKEVIKIVDFKCPSSNMKEKNMWSILNDIDDKDENL